MISFNQIDTTTNPKLIYFDLQTLGLDNGNFGYGGFVLLNDLGDTIAFENINTAGNVFGPLSYSTDTRILDVIQNFVMPFNGTLHLINGWFAGNPNTSCLFPFNININTNSIADHSKQKILFKRVDVTGREANKKRNTPLFYIYNDGTVEKKMIIE